MSAKKSSARGRGAQEKAPGQSSLYSFFSKAPANTSIPAATATPSKGSKINPEDELKTPNGSETRISAASFRFTSNIDGDMVARSIDASTSNVDVDVTPPIKFIEHRPGYHSRSRMILSDDETSVSGDIDPMKYRIKTDELISCDEDAMGIDDDSWMDEGNHDAKSDETAEEVSSKRKVKIESTPHLTKKLKKNTTDSSSNSTEHNSTKFEVKNNHFDLKPIERNKVNIPRIVESTSKANDDEERTQSDKKAQLMEGFFGYGSHLHHSFSWLKAENRMDANRRKPSDPDYNPRTLYVPPSFREKETAAWQQWWDIKSQNMDVVLFFKVGKFYELFHMDADIGTKELDLLYMKGEKAHSGFPEVSYGKFADILVEKGYRVARVEQTETPEALKERNKGTSGKQKSKVVRRELCSILSKGTRTFCYLDPPSTGSDEFSLNSYMIAFYEKELDSIKLLGSESCSNEENSKGSIEPVCEYGVCMVDTSTATFRVGQFADTKARFRLRTLLTQFPPSEVLYVKETLSECTTKMLKSAAPSVPVSVLHPGDDEWGVGKILQELSSNGYFDSDDKLTTRESTNEWPEILKAVIEGGKDSVLCLKAIGIVMSQLKRSLIDHDIISMKRFEAYIPPDDIANSFGTFPETSESMQSYMILDGAAVSNLEVLNNSYDGSEKGSLWAVINHCSTAFGRRLLRDWICKPLYRVEDINERLDAVEELIADYKNEAAAMRNSLKTLPDIERLLSRVHSMASLRRAKEHPDSRAQLFEPSRNNTRKIKDFCSVLDGLEKAADMVLSFGKNLEQNPKSVLLRKCLLFEGNSGGSFPDIEESIKWFRQAFDAEEALSEGSIKLRRGIDESYDSTKLQIQSIESKLNDHLKEVSKLTACPTAKYVDTLKEKYLIELWDTSKVPAEFDLRSTKKGSKRYWTPFVKEKLKELSNAESVLDEVECDQMRRLFEKFDRLQCKWIEAVKWLSIIDALLSLALLSSRQGYSRPIFFKDSEPFVRFYQSRHPCMFQTFQGGDFIPNDISLGPHPTEMETKSDCPSMILLSGPNMGGKSTILRQTCLIVILAQVGCFVPAQRAELTAIDRIFTRIGAFDRIMSGQSTFFVELSEAATILQHSSKKSLVILDELGRGTSTFDGTSIAHAVISHLLHQSQCLTLFATHYHSLVEEWGEHLKVRKAHMGCIVHEDSAAGEEKRVTFLYTLQEGSCPKSFGINVARLACLPEKVLATAREKSRDFEHLIKCDDRMVSAGRALADLFRSGDLDERVHAELLDIWNKFRA